MMHHRDRFLIPELNFVANDSELRNMQKKMLNDHYQKQIEQKHRRAPQKEFLYSNKYSPDHPQYRNQNQLDGNRKIREELSQTYQDQMERKQMVRRAQKEQERHQQQLMIKRAKEIQEIDRQRVSDMHESFRREAIEQVQEKEKRKMEEKRKEEEQKQAIQKKYNTNLLSLNKQQSFKNHYSNVNGMLQENERNYVSMVVPLNNERERQKQRIVDEGIRRSDARLRDQLRLEAQVAARCRQDLRDSLTQQIRQKEEKKRKDIQHQKSEGYTSMNYQGRHHPINNPVDFKITHDNKYIIGELQSGLARSGSKALLS